MRGKRLFVIYLAACLLTACTPEESTSVSSSASESNIPQSSESADTPAVEVLPQSFDWMSDHEVKHLSDIQTDQTFAVMNGVKNFSYPADYDFTPTYTYGDWLYGTAHQSDDIYLSRMNIETGKFETLSKMDTDDIYASIKIGTIYKGILVFEEYETSYGSGIIYTYDPETGEKKQIIALKAQNLHYWDLDQDEDGIMMCMYDSLRDHYVMRYLNMQDGSLTDIEIRHCSYPCYVNGHWYYELIDSETLTTTMVHYDRKSDTKTEIYSRVGEDNYINGMWSAGDSLLLTIRKPDWDTEVYLINPLDGSGEYLFDTTGVERVICRNGYLTWMGEKTDPERGRLQYHLYNLKSKVFYDYADGLIYLSDDHIAWIRYKKKDDDIEKGEVFTNENTEICAQQMK